MKGERASARRLEIAVLDGPGGKFEGVEAAKGGWSDVQGARMDVEAEARGKRVIRTYQRDRMVVETPQIAVWRWGRISERDA